MPLSVCRPHFAAVNLKGLKLSGFVGWLVWRSLYLVKLPEFGNQVRIAVDWTLDLLIERSIAQIRTPRSIEHDNDAAAGVEIPSVEVEELAPFECVAFGPKEWRRFLPE